MYLAERYDDLLPKTDIIAKYKAIEWTFWGSTEFSVQAKQFGFYFKYCTHKLEYCETRHRDKLVRLLSALERQLQSHNKHWITGDQYTIADLSVWPWLWSLHEGRTRLCTLYKNMPYLLTYREHPMCVHACV